MLLDISRLFLEFGFSIFLSFYIFFRGPGRMSDFFGTQRSARATCHHIGFAGQRSAGEIGQDRSWHGTWRNHCRLSWFRCIPLIIILFLPFFLLFSSYSSSSSFCCCCRCCCLYAELNINSAITKLKTFPALFCCFEQTGPCLNNLCFSSAAGWWQIAASGCSDSHYVFHE